MSISGAVMKNPIKFEMPMLRPLPGELTATVITGATLPVKIEAARRAIALCQDLPELLRYKDAAQGIAAAVRVMKHIAPEMVANANCMVKESIVRMGDLLLEYNGAKLGSPGVGGSQPSARTKIARELGICPRVAASAARIAQAPKHIRERILSDDVRGDIRGMASLAPARRKPTKFNSDALRRIFGAAGQGLSAAVMNLRNVPLDAFAELAPDECKRVKAKITECMELLDEMDRHLTVQS